ncbi:hypothetical protein C0991_005798 [Blastosporella zonata]|nr:hypothetical protein C0991_005798 [Blastosporella zonata]
MSLGEADGKFPTANQGTGLPPPPSRENPGQVFPKSDPQSAPHTPVPPSGIVGNPYLMAGALRKVDQALGEVIAILEGEERSHSGADEEAPLLTRFRRWREEIYDMREDSRTPPVRSRASPQIRSRTGSRSPEAGGIYYEGVGK